MKLQFEGHHLIVTREPNDPKYYGHRNAKGESNLFYAIKTELNKQGWGLIKKRMGRDGHLVDDIQQYLRTRKRGAGSIWPDVYIYNDCFALWGANEKFNEGEVRLYVDFDVFGEDPRNNTPGYNSIKDPTI